VIKLPPNAPIRFQLSGWTAIAAGLLVVTAIATAAFLALGLFVLVLPLLLIAPVVRHFLRKAKPDTIRRPAANENGGTIIDGNFSVIDRGAATEPSDRR
jgi:UPF0716 family protein affecting phage T7 exclusion